MHFLKFYASHGSATRFFRAGEKYYIYFVDSLSLYPTAKEFSKLVNSWWSYCKKMRQNVFWDTVYEDDDKDDNDNNKNNNNNNK